MKKQSRTTYTLYNFVSSMGGQAVTILTNFITRTVFIATLGKAYLGIGGLFSNILMMLSLAYRRRRSPPCDAAYEIL